MRYINLLTYLLTYLNQQNWTRREIEWNLILFTQWRLYSDSGCADCHHHFLKTIFFSKSSHCVRYITDLTNSSEDYTVKNSTNTGVILANEWLNILGKKFSNTAVRVAAIFIVITVTCFAYESHISK